MADDKVEKPKDGEKKSTVNDFYNEIDRRVQKFAVDFMAFLPKSDAVATNLQIIADRLLTVKESAKLLVNNFVVAQDDTKENSTDKESKDD